MNKTFPFPDFLLNCVEVISNRSPEMISFLVSQCGKNKGGVSDFLPHMKHKKQKVNE